MSQQDTPDGLTDAQREAFKRLSTDEAAAVLDLIDDRVAAAVDDRLNDSAPITRRDALTGGAIAAALGLGGGTVGTVAADTGDSGGDALSISSVTADTYRQDDGEYAGADSAKSQLVSELGGDDAGATYEAKDTGAKYNWTGSAWELLPAERKSIKTNHSHSDNQSPNIVVWEDADGNSYADTEEKRFTGSDIFDAAQQAIDARLSETRDTEFGSADAGDVHLRFKPGYYDVSNTISITKQGIERVTIETPGMHGCWVDTSGVANGETVIEIDPGPLQLGDFSERIFQVGIDGLRLWDPNFDRDQTGIYVNDTSFLSISNSYLQGYERGLWIRNIWQGQVDNVWVNKSGSDANSKPAIQVGDPSDTGTHQAINHIQLNHLQGDPGSPGIEHAWLEITGKATRIDVEYPNVELNDTPGIVIDGSNADMNVSVRGARTTGGAPAIQVKSTASVQIVGGQINATGHGSAIKADGGVAKLNIVGMRLVGGDGANAVDVNNGWASLTNCRIQGGERGIFLDGCGRTSVSDCTINESDQAGLKIKSGGNVGGHNVRGVTIRNAAKDDENPLWVEGTQDVITDNIIAEVDPDASSKAAVRDKFQTTNWYVGQITPLGNYSTVFSEHSGSTYRNNKGAATVSSGTTSVSVTHKLAETPNPQDISVTSTDPLGSASTWYLSNIGSSSFDINVDADPTQDVQFAWQAEL